MLTRPLLPLLLALVLPGCSSAGAALPIALKALAGVAALAEELNRPTCEERPAGPVPSHDGGVSADAAGEVSDGR